MTTGTVRSWSDEEGWGVVDSAETRGGCWVHFSVVDVPGYVSLAPGQAVDLTWQAADQDGFSYRAFRVRPAGSAPGGVPADDPADAGTGAYGSTLTITHDRPGWQFTDDVEVYAQHVLPLLAAAPAQNTVALTLVDSVRAGRRWSDAPLLFGWYAADGQVHGAMSHAPPFELLLADVPVAAVPPLVEALKARGADVPGVNGERPAAEAFAAAWVGGRGRATVRREERLYRLEALLPPAAEGRARPADDGDVALCVDWFGRFQVEAGLQRLDPTATVHDRVGQRLVWLWVAADGEPVSLAARNRTAVGVARVGPVYTPPEHRRRSYGAAVTAACTADALAGDAQEVVLFTDLANPTSNAVYQRIGFRPLCDHVVLDLSG